MANKYLKINSIGAGSPIYYAIHTLVSFSTTEATGDFSKGAYLEYLINGSNIDRQQLTQSECAMVFPNLDNETFFRCRQAKGGEVIFNMNLITRIVDAFKNNPSSRQIFVYLPNGHVVLDGLNISLLLDRLDFLN